MEKSVIWDLLPIILVVSVVFGSLFFVDFTGMVVTCTDVDGDGYNSCSGCEDVLDLSGMSGNFKKDSAVAFEKIVYTVQSPNAKNVVTYSVPKNNVEDESTTYSYSPDIYYSNGDYKSAWIERDNKVYSIVIDDGNAPSKYGEDIYPKLNVDVSNLYTAFQFYNTIDGTRNDIALISNDDGVISELVLSGSQMFPSVDGDFMVYQSDVDGDMDIYEVEYLADFLINSSSGVKIYDGGYDDVSPEVYGGDVVFQSKDENGGWDIYVHSKNDELIEIATNSDYDEKYPDIYKGKVVWSDNRDGYWNIYLYEIGSGEEYVVTSGNNYYVSPNIDQKYITWESTDGNIHGVEVTDILNCAGDFDCDDTNDEIYPGVTELCDLVDNNCDGVVDEGCGTCADVDLDGYEDLVCGGTDCDDTNDEIYPGVTELCDLVDNNCDGEIDEGCIPSCVLSTEWYDEDYYEITEVSSDDLISLYAEGDGICTSVTFGLYSTLYDGSSYVADSLVTEVSGVDDGLNGFYAELDLSTLSLEDGYYIFDAEGVESSTLLICSDLESCTDDFDLPETESCLYEGWDYNFFVDENLGYIAGAADGEEVTLFSLNDGSCTDLQFHLHELIDNGDGTFNTGILVETFSGDFYSEDYEGDTFYYDLSYWTASGLDSYYYFIVSAGDYATYGDSLYVCSVAPCDGLIVTPIDVDDVVATYGLAATGDDTTDDTTTTDTTIDSGDQGTEECPWDCTGVEWEECIDGVEFRDLSLCVGPEDPNCFVDDSSWPDYERSCGEGSVDYYDYSDDSYDEYRDTEDVPVFTWINMLLVVFVLVGYYWKRNL